MSHAAGSDDNAEPDLTAMLDVVMQLLMYFIVTVNFIDQEKNPSLQLPIAQVAKPVSADKDYLALSINQDGKLIMLGESPMDMDSARIWVDNQAVNLKDKSPDHNIHTSIKIRAHKDVDYDQVYQFMQMCKDKGFRQFTMQVMIGHGEEG